MRNRGRKGIGMNIKGVSIAAVVLALAANFFIPADLALSQVPTQWEYAGWAGGGAFPAIVADPNTNGKVLKSARLTHRDGRPL